MTNQSDTPYRSPIVTGLACRCPRCGRGRLFAGFLKVAARCEACDLDLSKQDAADGPAVFVIFILGAVIVPLALTFEAKLEPPFWVHLLLWPPVILGGALALLRPLKGVMIALQYKHQASEGGTISYDED